MSDITTGITAGGEQRGTAATYEYIVVHAPRDKESLYRDTYSNFGWTFEGYTQPAVRIRAPHILPLIPHVDRTDRNVYLRMKRDRQIKNRALVQELQRSAEDALGQIDKLERSRTLIPSVVAYALAIIGCVFLGGSVFSLNDGHHLLSIILGAIGIAWWIAPVFTYFGLRSARTAQAAPLIDQQFQVVYETSDKALHLLG